MEEVISIPIGSSTGSIQETVEDAPPERNELSALSRWSTDTEYPRPDLNDGPRDQTALSPEWYDVMGWLLGRPRIRTQPSSIPLGIVR